MIRTTSYALLLTLGLLLAVMKPSSAVSLFGPNDLQKALAAPEITVGDYTLDKDALTEFYVARDYHYAWDPDHEGSRAGFLAFLDSVDRIVSYNGLEHDNYAFDEMRRLAEAPDASDNTDASVKLELLTTDTILQLAEDLHGDESDLHATYPGWTFHRDPIDIPAKLAEVVSVGKLDAFFASLTPKDHAYVMLADMLPIYRAITDKGGWPVIASGPFLRPGDHDIRVGQLRARLVAENYLDVPKPGAKKLNVYDGALEKALETFQTRNGLKPDGHAGTLTLEALNIPATTRVDQIRANMERWRHMPDGFPGAQFVMINIPAMTIDINEDSKNVYSGIVIVGRVDRKTPFINSVVRSMIINPSWHVPLKIARKDILPKLKKDPHYLEKLGFVISGNDGDPFGQNIDWSRMREDDFHFRLRQAPSDQNSLGHIKFDFSNDFAVYMHDTPHRELFDKTDRALSSGCVRLHDPDTVAELLTADNKEPWTPERLDMEIAGGKTRWVGLTRPLPIYFVYWSIFPDQDGTPNFRKDVYDYDHFENGELAPRADQGLPTPIAADPVQHTEKNDDSGVH